MRNLKRALSLAPGNYHAHCMMVVPPPARTDNDPTGKG